VYIDAFRGLMALVMVQGHVCSAFLSHAAQANPLYAFQAMFHGSTAPGFLFASGFVAGLPRSPLSLPATFRRTRRLLFVLAVGYYLHLPYFSLWKSLTAGPEMKAVFFACDALQTIAVTQLFVIALQWIFGRRWQIVAGGIGLAVIGLAPWVWSSGLASSLHPALGSYFDAKGGSHFPLLPYSAFVLAGTVAGGTIGRQEPGRRHFREIVWGSGLLAAGTLLAVPLAGRVAFWGPSPAYTLMRIGGLLLLMRLTEVAADHRWPGTTAIALLGHETLQVYVLHLQIVYGSVITRTPLGPLSRQLGFLPTFGLLFGMLPPLYLAAWLWHRFKVRAPREATLVLIFLSSWFVFLFLARPW